MKIKNPKLILGIILVLFMDNCVKNLNTFSEENPQTENPKKEIHSDEVDLTPRPTRSKN